MKTPLSNSRNEGLQVNNDAIELKEFSRLDKEDERGGGEVESMRIR